MNALFGFAIEALFTRGSAALPLRYDRSMLKVHRPGAVFDLDQTIVASGQYRDGSEPNAKQFDHLEELLGDQMPPSDSQLPHPTQKTRLSRRLSFSRSEWVGSFVRKLAPACLT